MVYDWDNKETECYRLYVEERKSLDDVMQHMKVAHNFNPSKRAFQTQFKRWDFPSKQNPAHKNAPLVERTRQLWETNTTQKDMLRILNSEGFEIKERELMRVRAKNRWLLRVPNGTKSGLGPQRDAGGTGKKRPRDDETNEEVNMQDLERVIMEENAAAGRNEADLVTSSTNEAEPATRSSIELSPEVQQKRQQRLEKLQAESDERYASKKRRRRTRGWAGLPADPPGPPRFPSETTLDESKAYLHLDNERYRELRDQFQGICEEAGFLKKTVAGPEKWQAAKDRLAAENTHLNNEFYGPPNEFPHEAKMLALDVVCTDVTKRMRTLERRMTIAEAKNALQVNPEESRLIRNQFYEVLKNDHFTSKLEAGDSHWIELKRDWIAQSPLLQRITAPPPEGQGLEQQYSDRMKAIEVLCRDVMKRLRDDQTKRDPGRKKQVKTGPGPGPAPPRVAANLAMSMPPSPYAPSTLSQMSNTALYAPTAAMMPAPLSRSKPKPRQQQQQQQQQQAQSPSDLQIDPSLLAAASDPSLAPPDMYNARQSDPALGTAEMHELQQSDAAIAASGMAQLQQFAAQAEKQTYAAAALPVDGPYAPYR